VYHFDFRRLPELKKWLFGIIDIMLDIARRLWIGLFLVSGLLLLLTIQVLLYYAGPFRLGLLITMAALVTGCFVAGLCMLLIDMAVTWGREHPELKERKAKK
jgi:hypothetical protein